MSHTKGSTGLLLGAGFSFELGMPLGSTLTNEIHELLSPDRLMRVDERWARGTRKLSEHVDRLCKFMALPDAKKNYEVILGHLETEDWFFRRTQTRSSQTDRAPSELKGIFVDQISRSLTGRHFILVDTILKMLRYYDGLLGLAHENSPLWVFTLNHDIMLELIAARLGLQVSGGFSEEKIQIQLLPGSNGESRHLTAEVIRNAHLESQTLNFLKPGTAGINLLKIHGALDVFAFNDLKDMLRILPQEYHPHGVLEALYNISCPAMPPPRIAGVRFATDTNGNDLCLESSLVSGAHKFDARHPQVIPMDYLRIFKASLLRLDTLICIGYSFGDIHINLHIKEWMELSRENHLVIVGPGCNVPAVFAYLADRIECKSMSATEFLQTYAASPLTPEEVQIQGRCKSDLEMINNHPPNAIAWSLWDQPELWMNGATPTR
jgi:hypothetical protein